MQPTPPSATQRLDTVGWSALPLHRASLLLRRNGLDNHGTSQPLRWCRQSEPFIIQAGISPYAKFTTPAAFAQRTGEARYALLAPVEPYGVVGHLGIEP